MLLYCYGWLKQIDPALSKHKYGVGKCQTSDYDCVFGLKRHLLKLRVEIMGESQLLTAYRVEQRCIVANSGCGVLFRGERTESVVC